MTANHAKEDTRSFERFCRSMEAELGSDHDFRRVWVPLVDVKEDKNRLMFIVELPGVNEEDIEVSFKEGVLDLHGICRFRDEPNKADYVRIERHFGSFHRSFRIDIPIRLEDISVEFSSGVLSVWLPKCIGPSPLWTFKGKLARRCILSKRQCRPRKTVKL